MKPACAGTENTDRYTFKYSDQGNEEGEYDTREDERNGWR